MASPSKTRRQSTACDWCREHKVKCDTEQPSCRNCARRGVRCVTINLRQPSTQGHRQPPIGRRRRASVRATSLEPMPKRTAYADSARNGPSTVAGTTPSPGPLRYSPNARSTSRRHEYPPVPSPPVGHGFDTVFPDRVLPAVFSTSFSCEDEGSVHSTTQSTEPAHGASGPESASSGSQHTDSIQAWCASINQSSPDAFSGHSHSDSSDTLVAAHGTANYTVRSSEDVPSSHAVGSSSSQYLLAQWLDLFFMQNPAWEPVLPHFRRGLAFTAEIPLTLFLSLPPLPQSENMRHLVDLFFARIYPIYPVVDPVAFRLSLFDLQCKTQQLSLPDGIETKDLPLLACAYTVLSLAADEEERGVSKAGTQYLEAVYMLYAHLVATPQLASVQALLLLSVVLRNRNKSAASWGAIGQAMRSAHTIGLHRRAPPRPRLSRALGISANSSPDEHSTSGTSGDETEDLHARIWWTIYILERTMELESGRPSITSDYENVARIPKRNTRGLSFDYFRALLELARIKDRVLHLLYGGETKRKPVRDFLFEMGHIDRAILDWADTFPAAIRLELPGLDIFCDEEELHVATYVALQYHQTVMALHRPALFSEIGFLRSRINKYCSGTAWQHRLHFSLCIGAASARATLKAVNDLAMYAGLSRIITADQLLITILVLGIYVAKLPLNRMTRADLALVDTFGAQVEENYRSSGQGPEFTYGITLLRTQLCSYITKVNSADITIHPPKTALVLSSEAQNAAAELNSGGYNFDTDFSSLEKSWSDFWNEDFDKLVSSLPGQDTTSMFLLGIPQSWPRENLG